MSLVGAYSLTLGTEPPFLDFWNYTSSTFPMSFSKRILIYIAGQSLWLIFFLGGGFNDLQLRDSSIAQSQGKMSHQASFQFIQQNLLPSSYEKNPRLPVGTILEFCGRRAKQTIAKIIWLRGNKIFLPLRNTDSVVGNHFTNALLFNPHNSAGWILLFTFYRWEKWSSKAAQLVIFIGF